MKILLLVETAQTNTSVLHPSHLSLINAAKHFDENAELLIVSMPTSQSVNDELVDFARTCQVIIGCQRNIVQPILAMLAAKLDVPMITGVTKILNETQFERSTYAGQIIETVELISPAHKILSIDENAFTKADANDEKLAHITTLKTENTLPKIDEKRRDRTQPNLSEAKTIIAIGGGIANTEDLSLIKRLVAKLNAVIGAGRGAIDNGLLGTEALIGQSGQTVAPDLYLAIGVSGASQHIAGITDSKLIIAINKDPHAPIFEHADYGIVGDFREIVPKLLKALDK